MSPGAGAEGSPDQSCFRVKAEVRGGEVKLGFIELDTSSVAGCSSKKVGSRGLRIGGIWGLAMVLVALGAAPALGGSHSPIHHIVVIYQENHSFDNVLGRFCAKSGRCHGAIAGKLDDGSSVPLRSAPDIVPEVRHTTFDQRTAIDGGAMDGFDRIPGCEAADHLACYEQYFPSQLPNLTRLARHFTVSDRTFQMSSVPSWGAHVELVAAGLDGFTGDNPHDRGNVFGEGWGCDSGRDAAYQPTPTSGIVFEPSCIPYYGLNRQQYPYGGAYRATPVQPMPTIMDRLSTTGRSWRIYSAGGGYSWAICPTFAECLYTGQHRFQVPNHQVVSDARDGTLPNWSVVIPSGGVSQHNATSMVRGDDWIGKVVGAIEDGPEWSSTAIFITYDDCGCFYDHVPPPADLGIRVPMVIVSPYAKAHTTDSTTASMASILAFTEHTFGLRPLTSSDANAYDYRNAFDYNHGPARAVQMTHRRLPAHERRYLRRHPPPSGDT
jgi:phospholipase C